MAYTIRRVDYFYSTVEDQPGEAYRLLSYLANLGVDLMAFTAIPVGPVRTQLTIFPSEAAKLQEAARNSGFTVDGPHQALLVQGDDELGALAAIHEKLYGVGVNVYASSGVTDGQGSFGYVLYIRSDAFERAVSALDL